VRVSALAGAFRGKPAHPVGADGKMALSDHFRELRARMMRIALYLVVGTIVALFFYQDPPFGIQTSLFDLIFEPYRKAAEMLGDEVETTAVINDLGGPLMFQLKLCGVAAVVITAPLWLLEIWGFITPALHANERKWTRIFALAAGPLFLLGVATGYYVLPRGIEVLLGFTPTGGYIESLVDFNKYFSFITRMLVIFGIGFEIPLFVVMLNLAGVVSGKALARSRPMIILGTFVFAAVATPSTDPFSMLLLGIPMAVLFLVAEALARLIDRTRARNPRGTEQWADDEVSPL